MALPVMTIDGDVVAVYSHWTQDGSRIVTEATVRTADGKDVVVRQLGGSVDGIGMISMPGPELLAPGMTVALAAHRDVDLAQREHVVLDSVKVFAYPSGFVRTGPTKAGASLFWESGCVFVTVDDAGTMAIPGDEEFPIIDASIEEWNSKTASCSYLQVINEGRKSSLEVGRDNVNLIKLRDTSWCRPAVGDDPAHCYAAQAAGITTAVYVDDATSDRDGAILDADIEINGVNFAISADGESMGAGCKAELQNTLTHELGHLHGLEHPCLATGDPPRVDDLGNPVPQCVFTTDPEITEATMYNFQECGEVKKETLAPDDIAAICGIYPTNKSPATCDPVGSSSGGCCSVSGRAWDRPDVSLLLAGSTVLLLLRRRKASRDA
jgi:hypothetical protein